MRKYIGNGVCAKRKSGKVGEVDESIIGFDIAGRVIGMSVDHSSFEVKLYEGCGGT